MRCQQLSQNLGSFLGGVIFWFFSPPFFFWNSLKEVGKEGTGRADAVQRSFGVSGDPQRALPKKPAPSLGGLLLHSKDSESVPVRRVLQAGHKGKRKRKQMWNEPNEDTAGPKQASLNFSYLFPTRSRRKTKDEKGVAQMVSPFLCVFSPNLHC